MSSSLRTSWTSRKVLCVVATAVAVPLLLLAGMAAAKFELAPYRWIRDAYVIFAARHWPAEGGSEVPQFEADRIAIRTDQDVDRIRRDLVALLWGDRGFPRRLPDAIERGIEDDPFSDLPRLARIDELIVKMEFGIDSRIYHLVPERPNGRLVVFHKGHEDSGHFAASVDVIGRFIDEGYAVAALSMPLLGPNSRPRIDHPRFGDFVLTSHDQMQLLRTEAGHPLKFFIEPVIVALNYLTAAHGYSDVGMVGLSGGGWTTTVAAALDRRIRRSFPVAGSLPLALRSPDDPVDYEQLAPEFYWTATYPELYILGSSGGRMQLQILNAYDSCCFRAAKAAAYRKPVSLLAARAADGCFDVIADTTHAGHMISGWAMERIMRGLRVSHRCGA